MLEPVFLSLSELIAIHKDQIERYGGESGIRDLDLLLSAAGTPAASFGGEYLHASIEEMAAAYLFHLVKNHAFVDGNKRTGAAAAVVFLELNGIELEMTEDELYAMTMAVAKGEMDKPALTLLVRENLRIP